jgi:hypothetical protein
MLGRASRGPGELDLSVNDGGESKNINIFEIIFVSARSSYAGTAILTNAKIVIGY